MDFGQDVNGFHLPKRQSLFGIWSCGLLRAPAGHTGRPRRVFRHAHVEPENIFDFISPLRWRNSARLLVSPLVGADAHIGPAARDDALRSDERKKSKGCIRLSSPRGRGQWLRNLLFPLIPLPGDAGCVGLGLNQGVVIHVVSVHAEEEGIVLLFSRLGGDH